MSKKRVVNIGRIRIASKFGRYRFGIHKKPGVLSMGLGFMWFNAVRRNAGVR